MNACIPRTSQGRRTGPAWLSHQLAVTQLGNVGEGGLGSNSAGLDPERSGEEGKSASAGTTKASQKRLGILNLTHYSF